MLIFKKLLLDNPKVLAVFVKQCKMTVVDVKTIEEMIAPSPGPPTKKYEVSSKFCMLAHYVFLIIERALPV